MEADLSIHMTPRGLPNAHHDDAPSKFRPVNDR
jgi:hypothetical protein